MATGTDGELGDRARQVRDELLSSAGTTGPSGTSGISGTSGTSGTDEASVLESAPAAVVLIDLDRTLVIYANTAARALAPGGGPLPLDVDAWSEAAALTDLSGRPMRDTASPLSRVAQGIPVSGEPVAAMGSTEGTGDPDPDPGADADAGAPVGDAPDDRLLWVTGFPLSEAGGAVTSEGTGERAAGRHLALVVFLQLSGAGARRHLAMVRDRAVAATELSFTVSDARRPENPLVWVNPAFTRLTGYELDDVVGRNCRFLQGPNTDPAAVDRIRGALADVRPITEVLLNYRIDGSAYWNEVSISPVYDDGGEVVNFVGVQADVTERVAVESERRTALSAAEETREQLRMLTDSTAAMSASLDVRGAAEGLARIVVPAVADFCTVDLLDEVGAPASARRVVSTHRDPLKAETLRVLGRTVTASVDGTDAVADALAGGSPALLPDLPVSPPALDGDPELQAAYQRLRPRSAIVVPLRARGQVLGALTLGTELPYGRRYAQRDLYLVSDLAARAGLAVDNARLYAREHAAAATLQRSLMPGVPEVPGLSVASRYLVAADGAQVGGDWYDLLPLPDGAVGIAVGDVVGHDLRAAAAMGELRGMLRSYAWEGLDADAVIGRCDDLVHGLGTGSMATAFYGRLERSGDAGARRLTYSNAGHPPPLRRRLDGTVELLDGNLAPMIGATRRASRTCSVDDAEPGDLLVLYTDGLIEAPGLDPDEQTALLARTVAGLPSDADIDAVCDHVLDVMADDAPRDDAVLLAVRLEG